MNDLIGFLVILCLVAMVLPVIMAFWIIGVLAVVVTVGVCLMMYWIDKRNL